jgi:DNA-directed RNA polymerase subunit M/transcription elongation factor TFIIS
MRLRFCPTCSNLLVLSKNDDGTVNQICRNCNTKELLQPKNEKDAMILETNLRSGSSAGGASSGITVNNYTLKDPTLPHIQSISCPKDSCPSHANAELRDVIYIKTDPTNLKFQYVCTVCRTEWTN